MTITGHKHTKKDILAMDLAKNENAVWVVPYVDHGLPPNTDPNLDLGYYHYVLPQEMDRMIERENVLSVTTIKGHRYVFFEFQMVADFNIVIADDYAVVDIKSNWDGKVITVRVESDKEEDSDRVGEYLFKHEFDVLFDIDNDDIKKLEVLFDG